MMKKAITARMLRRLVPASTETHPKIAGPRMPANLSPTARCLAPTADADGDSHSAKGVKLAPGYFPGQALARHTMATGCGHSRLGSA